MALPALPPPEDVREDGRPRVLPQRTPEFVPVPARPAFAVTVAVVVLAGAVLRFVGLARQSYWGDELFSVGQASGTLHQAWVIGLREVHPPLYAGLLNVWIHLRGAAGTHVVWTHLLSALFGAATILVTWTGLRGSRVSARGRALATAATACSGFALVYAQETRSYGLLLLAATGLTSATVRLLAADRAGSTTWRSWRAWTAWGVLAGATHLFGLVLTLGALAVLLVRLPRRRLPLLGLGVVASLPQLGWLVGAQGWPMRTSTPFTNWIPAPTPSSVRDLVTTIFASGGLVPLSDGFAWRAPWGVLAVLVLLLVGAGDRLLQRRASSAQTAATVKADGEVAGDGEVEGDGEVAVWLLAVAVVVLAASYAVSQVVHLWTLRNLVVVEPALVWAVVLGVPALAVRPGVRRGLQWALVAATAVATLVVAVGVSRPYKTDFRGAAELLLAERQRVPGATFVIDDKPPRGWFLATDIAPSDPRVTTVFSHTVTIARKLSALEQVTRRPEGMVVVYYPGVVAEDSASGKDVDAMTSDLLGRLATGPGGNAGCSGVPVPGLVVVRCDPLA